MEAFRSRVAWTCIFTLATLKARGAGVVARAAKKVTTEAVGEWWEGAVGDPIATVVLAGAVLIAGVGKQGSGGLDFCVRLIPCKQLTC